MERELVCFSQSKIRSLADAYRGQDLSDKTCCRCSLSLPLLSFLPPFLQPDFLLAISEAISYSRKRVAAAACT